MAKTITDKSRYGKTKFSRFIRKQTGKGNFLQAEGFMKKYVPGATSRSAIAGQLMSKQSSMGKSIAKENAIDHLSGTLQKAYGRIVSKIWGTPLVASSVDKLVSVANKFVPIVGPLVAKIKKSGLDGHQINQLILMFRNSLTDAILEQYQEDQSKLPEDQRQPITKDDIADLFASHDSFAKWFKSDLNSAEAGAGLPKTEQVLKAVNEMEQASGDAPRTLKELQDDVLETIRELNKLGLLDQSSLFKWLK